MRHLRQHEKKLIEAILNQAGRCCSSTTLQNAMVKDMDDGGMGSILFTAASSEGERLLGDCIQAMALDSNDGTDVSISLNFDIDGRMYELDIWKVDFSPLDGYPDTASLKSVIVVSE